MRTAEDVDLSAVHYVSPIPPICRISAEVALEIFECCLLEDEFRFPSVRSAPLQLSHVCHTWRKLAIATPRLWCKLRLTRAPENCKNSDSISSAAASSTTALEVWMDRAGALPMSFLIRYPAWTGRPSVLPFTDAERAPPIFRIIVNNPTRWKALRLDMPSSSLISAWRFIQQNVLNLETLEINDVTPPEDCQKSSRAYFILVFCVRASIAKTLSTLSVHAAITYRNPPDTPLVRLRRLCLKYTAIDECLHLLNNCPSLEELTFNFCDRLPSTADVIISVPVILLPRLRHIHLTHCENCESRRSSDGKIGQLLDRLQLPQLKEFYLSMTIIGSDGSAEPNLPWDCLSRLITRSNCSLNRLELCSPHIVTASILECLRLSPDLKYLGIPADEELERNIAQLLPGLESLRIFDEWD